MNQQQIQQLKEILAQFSDAEKQDLKSQMGIDLDADLDPDNIDPELAKLLLDSGVLDHCDNHVNKDAEMPSPVTSKLTRNQSQDAACSFCHQPASKVGALITAPTGASICRKCIIGMNTGH